MELPNLEQIFGALNGAGVRYVLVGGLAVIAHGYIRYTNDIDLVIALEPANLERAITTLMGLGYRAKVPVNPLEFADPIKRQRWIEEKNMVVFQLINERFPREPIDVFVSEPFDVDAMYSRCEWREITPTIKAPVVELETLLAMKRGAGRGRDLIDVEQLTKLQRFRDER